MGHVVLCAHDKGGVGNSLLVAAIAAGLMRQGAEVATLDLAAPGGTLTAFQRRREHRARLEPAGIPLARHQAPAPAKAADRDAAAAEDGRTLLRHLLDLRSTSDWLVIDCPAANLARLAAATWAADALITPLGDSLADLEPLACFESTDPDHQEAPRPGRFARRLKAAIELREDGPPGWLVVRNRLAPVHSRHKRKMAQRTEAAAVALGAKVVPGLLERVVYRELFDHGLSPLDPAAVLAAHAGAKALAAAAAELAPLLEAVRAAADPTQATGAALAA